MQIRTINSIETSSICDNKCQYCPAPVQHNFRQTGYMTMDIFKQAIEWVCFFVRQGTQRELNLFGVGEPTLNPDIVKMVAYAKKKLPFRHPIHMNTNGKTMTVELARDLKAAGISHIDITGHDPYHTAKTIRIFQEVGIEGQLSFDYMLQPNNWANQVDWFSPNYSYPCPWLANGQVMVMSNGEITRCCLDAFAKGVFANIWDKGLNEQEVESFELCETCHQTKPEKASNRLILAK